MKQVKVKLKQKPIKIVRLKDFNQIKKITWQSIYESSVNDVIEQLEKKIHDLKGDFILKKNNYENDFCSIMGWTCVNNRYFDAINGLCNIELKKGQSAMWFDMVRYSEIFLGIGKQGTITLFINYSKKESKIIEIYVIMTTKIIEFLKIDDIKARTCIALFKSIPRGLNMQASATKKDLKSMAFRVIKP